jgi:hypothetical protein
MYTELCEMALRQTQPDFTYRMQKSVHFRFSIRKYTFFLATLSPCSLTLRLTRTRAHVDVAHETYARRASHVMQCSWHPW